MNSRTIVLFVASTLSLNALGCLRGHFGTIPPAPALGMATDDGPAANKENAKVIPKKLTTHPITLIEACNQSIKMIDSPPKIEGLSSIDARKLLRNEEANRFIMAIRQSHDIYNGRLSVHRANFDTGSDLALLAATAVSAINPGTAIGATSVAIAGAKASIDRNYYNDLSRTALLIDIYKNAQSAEDTITVQLGRPYADYSMSDACRDLDAFFRAGEAIRAVSASAAAPLEKPHVPPVIPPASPASPPPAPTGSTAPAGTVVPSAGPA